MYLTNSIMELGQGFGPLNWAGFRTEKDSEIFSPIDDAHLTPLMAEFVKISPNVSDIAIASFDAGNYHDTFARFQGEA